MSETVLIIIGVVTASVVFTSILIVGISLALKTNPAYSIGVEKACRNQNIVELLGQPIKSAFLMTGGVRGSGLVSLRVKLKGSRKSGKLHIQAKQEDGNYQFQKLEFCCGEKTIDLTKY